MSFLLPNNEEKPYNRCIDCVHIGKKCDGPDFLAMEIHRLCEWARLRKEYLHRKDAKWINAYVAERAEMSLTTVNRFFSGDIDDLKFSTAARILRVLVDGTWGQYPCAMVTDGDDAADLEAELNGVRAAEKLRVLREAIAGETGVPASLLTGETEDDCKAQAEAILAFARPSAYPTVPDGGEIHMPAGSSTRDQFSDWLQEKLNN